MCLFASAEIQQASGHGNWMLEAGMSEDWYYGLMLTFATVATAGTAVSSFANTFKIDKILEVGKLDGTKYKGIKFTQRTKSGGIRVRSLEFHTHSHLGHNPHWQLNKWSNNMRKGVVGRWTIWLRRI